jgi:hypothetical protein
MVGARVGSNGLLAIAIFAFGCGDDADDQAAEWAAASVDLREAICTCVTHDPRCTSQAVNECSQQVILKHAPKYGDQVECLIRRAKVLTLCYEMSECADLVHDVQACTEQVALCDLSGESRMAATIAIEQEITTRCAPLTPCRDGSEPIDGACPPVDAGPPPPTCAQEVVEASAGLASPACAQCVCQNHESAASTCDATCWRFLACFERECTGLPVDAGTELDVLEECLTQNCSQWLSGLSGAAEISRHAGDACMSSCPALAR